MSVAAKQPWVSTASIDEIAAWLRAVPSVALLTHAKVDGDAVGSTLAVARALTRIGIKATPVYMGLWSNRFDAVVGTTPTIREKHGVWSSPPLSDIQHALVLDTGSWNQLADAKSWLVPRCSRCAVIDHHLHGDADVAPMRFINTKAAAVCEIAAELCVKLLGVRSAAELPVEVAEPLLLGLASDTGWFKHSSTTPHVLHLAGDLMQAGARHNWLFQTVEQGDEPSRLKLIGRALSSLEFHSGSRIAILHTTQADLAECGSTLDDAGGLTDLPLTVGSVRVAASVVEVEPSLSKVSFRSKAGQAGKNEVDVDVNALAQTLGGGGHRHAAGVKIHKPLPEALEAVRSALVRAMER